MAVHEAPHERVLPALAEALAEQQEEKQEMASIAEQLMEKGEKKGIEKGIEKGQREMLLRQLRQRFGALPEEVVERVSRAGLGDIERWSVRLLTAPTLDDTLDGPHAPAVT